MKKPVLGLALLFLPITALFADFNDGAVAYSMGDYQTAYRTMQALAVGSEDEYAQYGFFHQPLVELIIKARKMRNVQIYVFYAMHCFSLGRSDSLRQIR